MKVESLLIFLYSSITMHCLPLACNFFKLLWKCNLHTTEFTDVKCAV